MEGNYNTACYSKEDLENKKRYTFIKGKQRPSFKFQKNSGTSYETSCATLTLMIKRYLTARGTQQEKKQNKTSTNSSLSMITIHMGRKKAENMSLL